MGRPRKNLAAEQREEETVNDVVDAGSVELEPGVDAILKARPYYAELYIDSQGGVYTADTACYVRGNAILYKNPYYEKL